MTRNVDGRPGRPLDGRSGRTVVIGMYVGITLFTGLLGVLVAVFGPSDLRPVRLLGLLTLQPTPVGLAIYGAVTVAVVLGVPLVAVAVLSRWRDESRRE